MAHIEYEKLDQKQKRDFWYRKIRSNHEFIKDQFKKEVELYLKMYRNQFQDLLPEEILRGDKVDVNVVYPIIKTLIPKLYFQDPKVFMKALQDKIRVPQTEIVVDELGQEREQSIVDPLTGEQLIDEYDGPTSAHIMESQINYNIRLSKLKQHVKAAIYDAHFGYYGVIKTGFGNEQGVKTMGKGAPISAREDINETLAYGIRLKPWDVIPDLTDFYNQEWTAIYYCVNPSKLKNDTRLKHTERIKGTAKLDEKILRERGKYLESEDYLFTEYYEIRVKPSAVYPKGYFLLISEEIDNDFIYESEWPYETTHNDIKFLYFNHDPQGGLPIPPVRYYANQQKAKSNIRRVTNEYVLRALPFVAVNPSGVKDEANLEKALRTGMIPKFVFTKGINPNSVFGIFSHPSLTTDFYKFDAQLDDDISRMVGMVKGVYPASGENIELAAVAKIADAGEIVRQNEMVDVVRDFVTEIIHQWVDYYKEFAGLENYTLLEGNRIPTKWTREQIRLRLDIEVKPFSMSYEDPVIRRRQWVDLLNLLGGPALQMALQKQGADIDFVKLIKRVLETYDEKDIETFLITGPDKPENQVNIAIEESFGMLQGRPFEIRPTDNHKVFILIENVFLTLLGEGMNEIVKEIFINAIAAHEQAILQTIPGKPGGGNAEGLPLKGQAVSQEQMRQPLQPSSINQKIGLQREATR